MVYVVVLCFVLLLCVITLPFLTLLDFRSLKFIVEVRREVAFHYLERHLYGRSLHSATWGRVWSIPVERKFLACCSQRERTLAVVFSSWERQQCGDEFQLVNFEDSSIRTYTHIVSMIS